MISLTWWVDLTQFQLPAHETMQRNSDPELMNNANFSHLRKKLCNVMLRLTFMMSNANFSYLHVKLCNQMLILKWWITPNSATCGKKLQFDFGRDLLSSANFSHLRKKLCSAMLSLTCMMSNANFMHPQKNKQTNKHTKQTTTTTTKKTLWSAMLSLTCMMSNANFSHL